MKNDFSLFVPGIVVIILGFCVGGFTGLAMVAAGFVLMKIGEKIE